MNRPPRIGIPLSLDTTGRVRSSGGDALYVSAALAEGLGAAGAVVVHVPPQPDVVGVVDLLDALLLPGGDDFLPPGPYAEGVHFVPVCERQLEFDRQLLRLALERSLPVLGICYGMQLLTLELGGTLCYDIVTEQPGAGAHRLPPGETHAIEWTSDAEIAGPRFAPRGGVGSRHHQCVLDPGPSLRAVAHTCDGVIEAVERRGDGFCVGVQWHPEDDLAGGGQHVLAALVDAARGRAG